MNIALIIKKKKFTFEVCASSTSLTICARAESCPTCVASMMSVPFWFMDPPITAELTVLFTGIDSPVISDSSTIESPSITRLSTGIFSPGTTYVGGWGGGGEGGDKHRSVG